MGFIIKPTPYIHCLGLTRSILINQVNVEGCFIFFTSGIYLIFFILERYILFLFFMCITNDDQRR